MENDVLMKRVRRITDEMIKTLDDDDDNSNFDMKIGKEKIKNAVAFINLHSELLEELTEHLPNDKLTVSSLERLIENTRLIRCLDLEYMLNRILLER